MADTLILMSHPQYAASRANRALAQAAGALPGVEVAHLEALYPDGHFDEAAEVARLLAARRVVLQFPVQWYATPPLLKAWQDAVLTRMFYINPNTEGAELAGRPLMVAATAGNKPAAYAATGANLFPLAELLRPLQATAHRCGLSWREPFLLYEARAASDAMLAEAGAAYARRLQEFRAG
ncbi:NAD(P)H-dependent oxidoreductase [Pseudoroseomonas ludipueritiae]|uniref:NAD(P)H-dependent oxidoreductase n=1 Tax=Pseudoroseomonas ludipueritiae TaxID=198093 RepID=A0ABR7RBG3_9PROT|nr:NAD(P)H-dependent oxidoreductase [Pseudoroseomonas ludipueritiae]MBC9178832.1 NAD(P)H-dependent oxidoreductase [Pseudoroseomonas ludipueritiae]MCG7361001.1 NAD(P)H-dependent oxidoreductase [Roseomonas sp. ACRSG]